jgi:hypothetical protein
VELIVGGLVVVGLLLVAGRFLLRSDTGQVVLPRVVDNSIGLWALRRVTRRPLWERPDEDAATAAGPAIANAAGASATDGESSPPAVKPTRSVVSMARPVVDPVADVARRAATVASAAIPGAEESPIGGAWPNRLAALMGVATVVVFVAVLGAIIFLPRGEIGGGVVTGSAGPSGGGTNPSLVAILPGASSSPSEAAGSPAPSSEPSSAVSPATSQPGGSPRPTTAPVRTPTPTAAPTPTPTPTAVATPKPTPKPTPAPSAPPPVASIACENAALVVTCDGTSSARALTYSFDFGDGATTGPGASPLALHAYADPGTYTVKLTVADSLGHTDSDTTTITVP